MHAQIYIFFYSIKKYFASVGKQFASIKKQFRCMEVHALKIQIMRLGVAGGGNRQFEILNLKLRRAIIFSFLIYYYSFLILCNSGNGQLNNKFTSFTFFCCTFISPLCCFNNIIANAQSKPGSLPCRFGCKKRVKDFINNFFRDAIAVIHRPLYQLFRLFFVSTYETVG